MRVFREAARFPAQRACRWAKLPGVGRETAWNQRLGISAGVGWFGHSDSHHFHYRPWGYSDDRESHEIGCGGALNEAFPRPGVAGCDSPGSRSRSCDAENAGRLTGGIGQNGSRSGAPTRQEVASADPIPTYNCATFDNAAKFSPWSLRQNPNWSPSSMMMS